MYQLTDDWFSHAKWEELGIVKRLPRRRRFLEVGSWEGRSMIYTVENLMEDGGELTCIDTWNGGWEHQSRDMGLVEQRFNFNQAVLSDRYPERKVKKLKGPSYCALQGLQADFDMIYIDGSHHGLDVMTDACLAWPLLAGGGLMIFDDYRWGQELPQAQKPKFAIDAFLIFLEDKFELIEKGYQVIVSKK